MTSLRGSFVVRALIATVIAACSEGSPSAPDASPPTTCASPLVPCGATCTDPESDPNNCGGCGTRCDTPSAQVCSQGQCALACGGGTSKCGSSCFNLQTDSANCGSCGHACPSGEGCSGGECADAGAPACGNACGPNTTCKAGVCTANLLTIAPTNVSGTLSGCTTDFSATGHKTQIGDANDLYVLMKCSGDALYVARSINGGISYSAPVPVGMSNVVESAIAVSHGTTPMVYVAAATSSALLFASSSDFGATWSTPATIDGSINSGYYGVSVATYGGAVYVQAIPNAPGSVLHVLRSGPGVEDAGFALTTVFIDGGTPIPNQVLVDSSGNVWSLSEDYTLFVTESTNGGASFTQLPSPPSSQRYSSWAAASGILFATGDYDPLYVVPMKAPAAATTIGGFGSVTPQQRSIATDSNGNVYLAWATNDVVVLDRVLYATALTDGGVADGGIESSRALWGLSFVSSPSVSSGPANTAFIAFTTNGGVYATVQTYE